MDKFHSEKGIKSFQLVQNNPSGAVLTQLFQLVNRKEEQNQSTANWKL